MSRTLRRRLVLGLAGLATWAGSHSPADAQFLRRPCTNCQPSTTYPSMISPSPSISVVPSDPAAPAPTPMAEPMAPMATPEPSFSPFTSAALGDSSANAQFQPAMFGDVGPISGKKTSPIAVVPTIVNNGNYPYPMTHYRDVTFQMPTVSYAGFKIAENESPRPTDRVFGAYNYFANVPTSKLTPDFDVHRETVGFEKTLLDGRASIGLRVPFLQLSGPDQVFRDLGLPNLFGDQFGDITLVTKYAIYDDRVNNDLISVGLAVTFPTGEPSWNLPFATVHSTLYQPYVGYIFTNGRGFVQGFSSIVVPSRHADVTAFYNDFAVGYWLRKDKTERFFHGIVPTLEVHVGTPVTNRSGLDEDRVHMPDYVSFTGGVNFVFWRNSTIGFAAGAPITGPQPWTFEALGSLNIRF